MGRGQRAGVQRAEGRGQGYDGWGVEGVEYVTQCQVRSTEYAVNGRPTRCTLPPCSLLRDSVLRTVFCPLPLAPLPLSAMGAIIRGLPDFRSLAIPPRLRDLELKDAWQGCRRRSEHAAKIAVLLCTGETPCRKKSADCFDTNGCPKRLVITEHVSKRIGIGGYRAAGSGEAGGAGP